MRSLILLIAIVAVIGSSGCNKPMWSPQRAPLNTWAVEQYYEDSIRNGVIAQHTVYDHHFHAHSTMLNELGQRDVRILAEHYREYPGELNVRRGSESDDLYRARVSAVTGVLSEHGVDITRITIGDDFAGGPGMPASQVVIILENMYRPLTPTDSTSVVGIPVIGP